MKLLRLLPALVLATGLVACGDSGTPAVSTVTKSVTATPAAAPHAAVKRVGLVMKTLTNPFFIEMEKGARRAEKELGIELLVKTAAQETSIEQQIQIVDDLIAAKVDAIVIAPGDSQSLVPSLKKAAAAGIKLINIDNRIDPGAVKAAGIAAIPFISVNNDKGAYDAAKFLAEGARANTKAAILEGIRSADNGRQRMEGAKRALAENKNVKLVASETANWKVDEAYEVTRKLLSAHPDLRLIFASNDMMAIGALKYAQEQKKSIRIAGYDALNEAVEEVKAGRLVVTVDQQAAEQGYQGIVLATRLLKGETVPELTLIETRLITASAQK